MGDKAGEDPTDDTQKNVRFVKQNWHFFKKSEYELRKLPPQVRSRYNAYEEPPKPIAEQAAQAQQRIQTWKKDEAKRNIPPSLYDLAEKDKHEKLIGQLKAAEARNRIRIMRLRYEANRKQEVRDLIMCQPTARQAVRLQALLPVKSEDRGYTDNLSKLQRGRVESLLEDSDNLLVGRT